jgi:alkylhydroperoxidase family enzyme
VREAHPTDGWRMASNDKAGIAIAQPLTFDERNKVAEKCCSVLEISMPLLVDALDDRVGHAYSGMPDRLYVIDPAGLVAYKGGRGPFGFKTDEMEQALIMLLLDENGKKEAASRFPLLNNVETWKRLPPAEKGADQPLPVWARALATSLPRTTAAMLELDYLHRARNPLDAKLRGKMRWVAADASGCAYSRAYAEADLRRAGVSEADLKALSGDPAKLPAIEKAALTFARKMTLNAAEVTDEEVAQLIATHGEKKVVAMVLLLAYAKFQDRLFLTLGVSLEKNGPLPPLEVRFAKSGGAPAPLRKNPEKGVRAPEGKITDPEWLALGFDKLQEQMEGQRQREGRIAVPSWEEVKKHLPATSPPRKQPLRIKWSLVCLGYQPELALGWSACTSAFGKEAKQDRVFEESLFWVVTRTLQCYY